MEDISTISISKRTKKILEKRKGKNKTWDDFLRELVAEKERLEALIAAKELENKFSEDLEEGVKTSSRELRRDLKFEIVKL